MWRQHIELALKQIIVEADKLLDQPERIPTGHNLASLWQRCRRSLEAIDPPSEQAELDNVEHVIAELHAMDPRGDAFRYAVSRTGDKTLAGIARLSFADINAALEPLANSLRAPTPWSRISGIRSGTSSGNSRLTRSDDCWSAPRLRIRQRLEPSGVLLASCPEELTMPVAPRTRTQAEQ